jgi:hypothetical protein
MPLAFSEGQLEQIKTFAYQLPRHLCGQYLHHLGTEEPLCRSRGAEDEAYRFIWHSSFDGAAMVHIASKREATALRWNYLRLRNGQTCGTMVLSAADWGRLHRTLDAAKFWSLDASGNRSGLDGADWLIEEPVAMICTARTA